MKDILLAVDSKPAKKKTNASEIISSFVMEITLLSKRYKLVIEMSRLNKMFVLTKFKPKFWLILHSTMKEL